MTTILYDANEGIVGCDTAACIGDIIHPFAGIGKMMLTNDNPNQDVITKNSTTSYLMGPRLYVFSGMVSAGINTIAIVRDVEIEGSNSELMFGESPDDLEVNLFEFRLDEPELSYRYDNSYVPSKIIQQGLYALGSGSHLAIGARSAGASVKESIEIAIEHDSGSGGVALVYDLNKKELIYGNELVGDSFKIRRVKSPKKTVTKTKRKRAKKD